MEFQAGGIQIGTRRFFLIAGPCVLENKAMALDVAHFMAETCKALGIPYIFKSSYDKANRTSISSFRGPGLKKGVETLARIREEVGIPVLTDIHAVDHVDPVAASVDILQIPAFLVRQTDLIVAAASSGRPLNIKKAQFLAPWDMTQVVAKAESTGNKKLLLTERGTIFGYNNLVVDMRSIPTLKTLGYPVVFDATHSVQLPGGQGLSSGGQRQFVPNLARAAVAAGADGIFMEVHPEPAKALCDGPNSVPLEWIPGLLEQLLSIYAIAHEETGFEEINRRDQGKSL